MIIRWPFVIRHIEGSSMLPTLKPDQIVVGFASKNIKPGNLAVVRYNGAEIIKRVNKVDGAMYFVVGDNPSSSTDSRQFGWVNSPDVLYKVIIARNLLSLN